MFVAYQGGDGFTLRDVHRGALEALEESSVDFYVAMRFAYLTNREAEVAATITPVKSGAKDDETSVARKPAPKALGLAPEDR